MQLGAIAQGLTQYLSMTAYQKVWRSFGSWLRTIRPDVLPSEAVVASAMRHTVHEFLADPGEGTILAKFIADQRKNEADTPQKWASNQ